MKMATEYGKRLKLAMQHAGLTQKALVKSTGIAQSSISSALNRGSGSADTPRFAAACGVSALWLASGEGDMLPQGIAVTAPMGRLTASGTTQIGVAPADSMPNQGVALVNASPSATNPVAEQSALATALAQLFDTLPNDVQLRATTFAALFDLLMQIKRGQTPAQPAAHLPAHDREKHSA